MFLLFPDSGFIHTHLLENLEGQFPRWHKDEGRWVADIGGQLAPLEPCLHPQQGHKVREGLAHPSVALSEHVPMGVDGWNDLVEKIRRIEIDQHVEHKVGR